MSAKPDSIKSILDALFTNLSHDAMVAVKANMHPTGSAKEPLNAINHVEPDFRETFPIAKWLFFEPDNRDE